MRKDTIINQNKYALITGATGGLGQSFCKKLANQGYNLILTGTQDAKLKSLKQSLEKEFSNLDILYCACDLSNHDSRLNLIDFLNAQNCDISLFVSNAGYITEGSIENSEIDTIIKCIQVNCEGSIHLTKAIIDRRNKTQPLHIISITSMAANYPMPYMAIYASTKALLKNFMISLRHEYKNENIKILIVEPGAIATSDDMKKAIEAQGFKGKLSCVAPDIIADKSIRKSLKNKDRYVPGFFNKMTLLLSSFAPSKLKTKAIGKMWKKSQNKRNID
jgi:short-subunit dehydrogenase